MVSDTFIYSGKNVFELNGIPDFSLPIVKSKLKIPEPSRTTEPKTLLSIFSQLDIAPWGDDNLAPTQARAKLLKVALAARAMKLRIRTHFGKGLLLYKEVLTTSEKIQKVPVLAHAEFEEFAKRSNLSITQARFCSDWEWYSNIFCEIILSEDAKKITRINRLPAEFCRWQKLNPINFKSEFVYFTADWTRINTPDDVQKIRALDWDNPIDDLRIYIKKGGKLRKFILPIKMEEMDAIYYDTPYWTSILDTYVPIALTIPKVKQALLKNQMVLKFHIKIPFNYWLTKYPNWNNPTDFPDEKKSKIINDTLDEMSKFLSDVENTGKSFISHYGTDPLTGKISDEWKIEPIDNNRMIKDGSYVVDAKAAKEEIISAIGVDNTLLGGLGGSETGSGSNKREAFNILQAELSMDRMITTKWFDYVKDYNNWDADLKIGYRNIDTSETLNENPTGSKETL